MKEEYSGDINQKGNKGGNFIDVTLEKEIKGKKVKVRINTVDIRKSGKMTTRESNAADKINIKIQQEGKNPKLITIPKGSGTGDLEKVLKEIEEDFSK